MSKNLLAAVGALLVLVGLLWTLQGFGVVGGSAMSGEPLWAFIGPVVALVGVALAVTALRRRPPS